MSTMTLLGHSEISPVSRNTFVENMVRRNGNVRNVQNAMQFSQTGRHIPRLVALVSIGVIVALYSPGNYYQSALIIRVSVSVSVRVWVRVC